MRSLAGPGAMATVATGAATHAGVFAVTVTTMLVEEACCSGAKASCTEVPVELTPVVVTASHGAPAGVVKMSALSTTNSALTRGACTLSVVSSVLLTGSCGARTVTRTESRPRGPTPPAKSKPRNT